MKGIRECLPGKFMLMKMFNYKIPPLLPFSKGGIYPIFDMRLVEGQGRFIEYGIYQMIL